MASQAVGFLQVEVGPGQPFTEEQQQGATKRDEIKLGKIGPTGSFNRLPWIMLAAVVISFSFSVAGLVVYNNQTTEVKFPLYRPELIYTYTKPDNAPGNSLQVTCAEGSSTAVCPDVNAKSSIKDTYEYFYKKVADTCSTSPQKQAFTAKNSWQSDDFSGVLYAHADTSLSPWPFTIAILWVTFGFSGVRYAMWTLLHLYDPDGPQFFRWFEYVLSSPLMIVLIAVAAGVRDVWTVAALAGVQALLIMCGYLIETLVDDLWACYFYKLVAVVLGVELDDLAKHEGHSPEGFEDNRSETGSLNSTRTVKSGVTQETLSSFKTAPSMSASERDALLPSNSRASSTCGDVAGKSKGKLDPANALYMMYLMFESHDARPYTKKGIIGSACAFKYESGRKLVLFRLLITVLASWTAFIIIWGVILSAYDGAEKNYNSCTGRGTVPGEIRFLVITQIILFALFGLNNLWQIWQSYRHLDGNTELMNKIINLESDRYVFNFPDVQAAYLAWYENYLDNWYRSAENYEVLNIISKSFLAIAILQISASSGSS